MNNLPLNKLSLSLFGGALLGAGLLSNPANADVHYEGDIHVLHYLYDSYDYWGDRVGPVYTYGWCTIDLYGITVTEDSTIIFDTLSYNYFAGYMAPKIMLFSGLISHRFSTDNYIAGAYIGPPQGFDTNGSISTADAFMEVFLTRGTYTLAVGTGWFSIDDLAGAPDGDPPFALGVVYHQQHVLPGYSGHYELDILGPVIHPTPGALALIGMAGLLSSRRRR